MTQSPGWRQSGDFSNLSPSVLSKGTALNKITCTKSNLQTWKKSYYNSLLVLYEKILNYSFLSILIVFLECQTLTLSACRRQSILRILPFWSGFESTHIAGFFPVIDRTKSSRHSWAMSFRNFPNSLDAHFCFTSGFSAYKRDNNVIFIIKLVGIKSWVKPLDIWYIILEEQTCRYPNRHFLWFIRYEEKTS